MMLTTAEGNTEVFTVREVECMKLSRKVYFTIGHPSPKGYKDMVRSGLIRNLPVTVADINVADNILGPDIS